MPANRSSFYEEDLPVQLSPKRQWRRREEPMGWQEQDEARGHSAQAQPRQSAGSRSSPPREPAVVSPARGGPRVVGVDPDGHAPAVSPEPAEPRPRATKSTSFQVYDKYEHARVPSTVQDRFEEDVPDDEKVIDYEEDVPDDEKVIDLNLSLDHSASQPSQSEVAYDDDDDVIAIEPSVATSVSSLPLFSLASESVMIPDDYVHTIRAAFGFRADLLRDVLKVPPSATPRDLRIAYFRRGREVLGQGDLQNDGDLNAVSAQAQMEFQAISMAYEIATHPRWRTAYEKYGLATLDDAPSVATDALEAIAEDDDDDEFVCDKYRVHPDTSVRETMPRVVPEEIPVNISISSDPKPRSRPAVRWHDHVEELVYTRESMESRDSSHDSVGSEDILIDDQDQSVEVDCVVPRQPTLIKPKERKFLPSKMVPAQSVDSSMASTLPSTSTYSRDSKRPKKQRKPDRILLDSKGLDEHLAKLDEQAEKSGLLAEEDFWDDLEASVGNFVQLIVDTASMGSSSKRSLHSERQMKEFEELSIVSDRERSVARDDDCESEGFELPMQVDVSRKKSKAHRGSPDSVRDMHHSQEITPVRRNGHKQKKKKIELDLSALKEETERSFGSESSNGADFYFTEAAASPAKQTDVVPRDDDSAVLQEKLQRKIKYLQHHIKNPHQRRMLERDRAARERRVQQQVVVPETSRPELQQQRPQVQQRRRVGIPREPERQEHQAQAEDAARLNRSHCASPLDQSKSLEEVFDELDKQIDDKTDDLEEFHRSLLARQNDFDVEEVDINAFPFAQFSSGDSFAGGGGSVSDLSGSFATFTAPTNHRRSGDSDRMTQIAEGDGKDDESCEIDDDADSIVASEADHDVAFLVRRLRANGEGEEDLYSDGETDDDEEEDEDREPDTTTGLEVVAVDGRDGRVEASYEMPNCCSDGADDEQQDFVQHLLTYLQRMYDELSAVTSDVLSSGIIESMIIRDEHLDGMMACMPGDSAFDLVE